MLRPARRDSGERRIRPCPSVGRLLASVRIRFALDLSVEVAVPDGTEEPDRLNMHPIDYVHASTSARPTPTNAPLLSPSSYSALNQPDQTAPSTSNVVMLAD
ncbi:hypothetical protein L1887_42628 [Cichorium endivia]|nr:hypothetical protein L1887_42628 [Cichorium endivia]